MQVVRYGKDNQQAAEDCGKILPDKDCKYHRVREKCNDGQHKLNHSIDPELQIPWKDPTCVLSLMEKSSFLNYLSL